MSRKPERLHIYPPHRRKPLNNRSFGTNGGIVLPQKLNLVINHMPGSLAAPVAISIQKPGGVELGIVGGLSKLEVAAMSLAATIPHAEWEADPEGSARKAIVRATALGAVLAEMMTPPKEGGEGSVDRG